MIQIHNINILIHKPSNTSIYFYTFIQKYHFNNILCHKKIVPEVRVIPLTLSVGKSCRHGNKSTFSQVEVLENNN